MASPPVLPDKYEVERQLGSGGMGTVFLARHRLLQQRVAVKVLNPEAVNTPDAVERFMREARVLAAVRHPAVCQVFDVDTTADGAPFIVMEYLQGQTLDQVLKASPRTPIAERVRWVIEAAEGLAAAHARGVIHRDVKPANLMLCGGGSGTVKVLDFGVAKQVDDHASSLTRDLAVGTVKYMSPEQLQSSQLDQRTDVWSLAVTLYQLLSQRFPFDGDSLGPYIHAVMASPPQPLAARGVSVPPGLAAALDAALRPLDVRTPDMQAFIKQLRPFAVRTAGPAPTEVQLEPVLQASPTRPLPSAPARPVGRAPLIAAGLGLLLGLVGGVVALGARSSPVEPAPADLVTPAVAPPARPPLEPPTEPAVAQPEPAEPPIAKPTPADPPVAQPTPVARPKPTRKPSQPPRPVHGDLSENPEHL